ncbi:hypothetical protein CDAR_283511 [Caerostris darwini]|uniref:Uncharacterized protein n=1 Tax=Caerostris darwini TaxID=1538125 RepID=A0AAV4PCY7_9ARAC|nr:hypothetical protein CDAR_283511 [Caerostris darwini]
MLLMKSLDTKNVHLKNFHFGELSQKRPVSESLLEVYFCRGRCVGRRMRSECDKGLGGREGEGRADPEDAEEREEANQFQVTLPPHQTLFSPHGR